MVNFGFKISESKQIDLDKANFALLNYVIEKEPTAGTCILCGTCGATCTAGQYTDFSLRKINLWLQRGEIDLIRENISKCVLCGKCVTACPRGVNTRNILAIIKDKLL